MCANRLCFYLPESFKNTSGEKRVEVTKAKSPCRAQAPFPLSVTVAVRPGLQLASVSGLCSEPRSHCPSYSFYHRPGDRAGTVPLVGGLGEPGTVRSVGVCEVPCSLRAREPQEVHRVSGSWSVGGGAWASPGLPGGAGTVRTQRGDRGRGRAEPHPRPAVSLRRACRGS